MKRLLNTAAAVRLAAAVLVPALSLPVLAHADETRAVPESQAQVLLSFAPVVKAATPAVVNIYTRKRVAVRNPMMDDPFFRRFFGDQMRGMPRERVERSLGSGVILGSDGTIVTNNHVIEGADEITVALSDGREFEAKLQIADPRTDLAVLKFDAGGESLPTLNLADSDAVEVGDIVLAIGNPFGVGQTVTQGIVSAVARTKVGVSDYRFFIQTDAAINPGNSGGALIDLKGRLVGINSSIYSRDGGSLGIGFAIPSSMVRSVIAAAKSGGRIVRPWLGASGQPLTSDLASSLGLDRPRGVLVNSIVADGPAARGGVKVGDVILSVDGHPVGDEDALSFRLATHDVGGKLKLGLWRKGEAVAVTIPLEAPPEKPARDKRVMSGRNPFSGATVLNLSPAVAEEMGRDTGDKGVVIAEIEGGTPADRVGFKVGDRVLEVNGTKVASTKELAAAIEAPSRAWRLTIERGGREISTILPR
ncbi:DegQ family serine endoprotease [Zavarzinia compransoris]|uniref:DegQ family serine endoprotease n=1 Tax=Zavarzinia marina TaxID=2911065 RepID=UPI001F27C4E4|nr:DegQ family serine endoprotease [Zavarzinia marina]MCF4167114.1 DegQ family serine endoprotease [Zavarzinia marina]